MNLRDWYRASHEDTCGVVKLGWTGRMLRIVRKDGYIEAVDYKGDVYKYSLSQINISLIQVMEDTYEEK